MPVPRGPFSNQDRSLLQVQDDAGHHSAYQQRITSIVPRALARLLSWHSSIESRTPPSTKANQSASLGDIKTVAVDLDAKSSSLHRVSSANINIPLKKCASERLVTRTRRGSSRRRFVHSSNVSANENANDKCQATDADADRDAKRERSDAPTTSATAAFTSTSASAWRKQQRECANCGQIAFRSMRDDDRRLGAYCSLDCKTSHGYMALVHASLDAQLSSLVDTWVDNGSSCSESSGASFTSD